MPSLEFVGLTIGLGLVSHAIAAASFLALSLILLASWKRGSLGALLIATSITTTLWAAMRAYDTVDDADLGAVVGVLEHLRSAGWIAFLLGLLRRTWGADGARALRVGAPYLIGALCVLGVGFELGGWRIGEVSAGGATFHTVVGVRLVIALFGLLLIENLFTNTKREHRWSIKFFCFGVGAIFVYDFYLYSDALLFERLNLDLYAARCLTNAIIVPLIAVSAARNPNWSLDVFVSRQVVFRTATLVGAGIYLLLMAAAGYYLREFGGEWGTALQVTFLFAAIILLLLVSYSGVVRAWLKININKHFFNYKYDYRTEWLKFIATISSQDSGRALPERVVEGVAALVESPGGAIWSHQGQNGYRLIADWNCATDENTRSSDVNFTRFLEERKRVIDLDEFSTRPEAYDNLTLPAWITHVDRAWLLVPLLHHERLAGLLLLTRPRAPTKLNWEDFELLTTVGRQAASYLAEHEAARALVEAQQFNEFNRRFAFVIHDIKNLVSQLSLLVSNAKKHRDNPEFQHDMLETVQESVEKMNRLLIRLHESGERSASGKPVSLVPFLQHAVERNVAGLVNLSLRCATEDVAVIADEERLGTVLAHLIENALDAASDDGEVEVRLAAEGGDVMIEVADNGPGMAPDFIRNELFIPFQSTKDRGYGIGAFESREIVRELGGKLDVISNVGTGTTIRITLPAAAA